MNNYRKLDLRSNPLKNEVKLHEINLASNIVGSYNIVSPHEILSDTIQKIFNSLNLKPRFVVLFGANNKIREYKNTY